MANGVNDLRPYVDIVMCRVFDQFITQGFDRSIIDHLATVSGFDIDRLLAPDNDAEIWQYLADPAIYQDADRWNALVADPSLLQAALNTLGHYYDWWLDGDAQITAGAKVIDDKNRAIADWRRFNAIFPAVSFSLSLVSKYSDADIVQKIALGIPRQIPDMVANDLWTQRRALMTCVSRYGTQFIVNNLVLRYELVCYVLLKADFNRLELMRLKEALLAEESHEVIVMMEAADVVELIERA